MSGVELRKTSVGDCELAWWERAGPEASDAPPLVVAHATGFHGRCYDPIVEHFPDRRVLQLDMRGHGRSGGGPIADWRVFAGDIAAVLDTSGVSGAVGVGHSMGAHSLLQAAAQRPDLFTRLVLFDPVILAPDYYADPSPMGEHPTARRKADFESVEQMIERFGDRDPYDIFDRRVFELYCRFGLVPKDNGEGLTLACAPQTEASIYQSSRSNGAIFDAARKVDIPVLVVRAQQRDGMDFKGSPTWPELASIIPDGTDLHRPDMTHFHPFQDPADAARIVSEYLGTS